MAPLSYLDRVTNTLGYKVLDTVVYNSGVGGLAYSAAVGASNGGGRIHPPAPGESGWTLRELNHRYYLSDHILYGSSRLGRSQYWPGQHGESWQELSNSYDTGSLRIRYPWYSRGFGGLLHRDSVLTSGHWDGGFTQSYFIAGQREYELTNHLGNVHTTVSDTRYPLTGAGDSITGYHASVRSAYDYYPYGMLMPGRYLTDTGSRCLRVSGRKYVTRYEYTWLNFEPNNPPHAVSVEPVPIGGGNINVVYEGAELVLYGSGWWSAAQFKLDAQPGEPSELTLDVGTLYDSWQVQIFDGDQAWEDRLVFSTMYNSGNNVFNYTPTKDKVMVVLANTFNYNMLHVLGIYHPKKISTIEDVVYEICNDEGKDYRFGFNGQMKDNEVRGIGNSYDFKFRGYDPRIGRFTSVDPMAHERSWVSPYNFVQNNPINRVDPTGALDNPIYDAKGNLLGTDDQGLQGKAIIMDKDKFSQGMKHEDAMKNSLGYQGLKDDAAKAIFSESYKSLPSRPDYDGKLTLDEANKWYREGGGKPLFVDASKIDLSPVKKSDFGKVGDSFYKNFAFTTNTETGLVYGNIKLTLMDDKGVIKLGGAGGLLDKYDFDYKSGAKNIPRNIATWIGEQKAGKGTGYTIFNYGTGTVK